MDDSVATGTRQYVLFRLCQEEYGLPVSAVQSIIRYQEPTPVPHAPEGVEGVFNLRGQVLPLIDLGRRLRGEVIVPTSTSRIIVAESDLGPVGLAVDAVREVANLPLSEIKPAPQSALVGALSEAFQGVATYQDRLVILLDPNKALPKASFGPGAQEGDPDA